MLSISRFTYLLFMMIGSIVMFISFHFMSRHLKVLNCSLFLVRVLVRVVSLSSLELLWVAVQDVGRQQILKRKSLVNLMVE